MTAGATWALLAALCYTAFVTVCCALAHGGALGRDGWGDPDLNVDAPIDLVPADVEQPADDLMAVVDAVQQPFSESDAEWLRQFGATAS